MNSPEPAARPVSPWQRDLFAIAGVLDERVRAHAQAEPERAAHTLWWGAGYSAGLLSACAYATAGSVILADTDPRRLQRSRDAIGGQSSTVDLLALADLRRDRRGVAAVLQRASPRDVDGYLACEEQLAARCLAEPAIPDAWASRVVMEFVLNRVPEADEAPLLAEALRAMDPRGVVLGIALVSDTPTERQIIQSAPVGQPLRLPTETALVRAFERAGFHGIRLFFTADESPAHLDRIHDADIRVCLIEARKGTAGPCLELGQAVIYGGPWREVRDDDGHVFRRGERIAVCAKTYEVMMRAPYRGTLTGLRCSSEPPLSRALPFDCSAAGARDPQVTKGSTPLPEQQARPSACAPGSRCC